MKKILCILLIVILLSGCTKEKFSLEDKYYNNSNFSEIDKEKLKELEDNSESFLVMVYTTGCFSCMDFEKVLTEFTKENNLTIFRININDIEGTKIEDKVKYTPSLAIYKKGNLYKYLDANSDKDTEYYKSTSSLKKWLDKYIILEND